MKNQNSNYFQQGIFPELSKLEEIQISGGVTADIPNETLLMFAVIALCPAILLPLLPVGVAMGKLLI